MNYIKHLNNLFDKVKEDERLTPFHVSLYIALFHFWNLNHFKNPFSIARAEIMDYSKIGSTNTYTRILKDLDKWSYLHYHPSRNQHQGSRIAMISFDNSTDKSGDNTSDKSSIECIKSDNTSDNTTDNTSETQVRRSINYINNNKPNINYLNNNLEGENFVLENDHQPAAFKSFQNTEEATLNPSPLTEISEQLLEKKKVAQKKKSDGTINANGKQKQAEHFFSQSQYFDLENLKHALQNTDYANANLKYYHEVINNWAVSKGVKKVDWLATIKNWILKDAKDGKLVKDVQASPYNPYDNDAFRARMAKFEGVLNRDRSKY